MIKRNLKEFIGRRIHAGPGHASREAQNMAISGLISWTDVLRDFFFLKNVWLSCPL